MSGEPTTPPADKGISGESAGWERIVAALSWADSDDVTVDASDLRDLLDRLATAEGVLGEVERRLIQTDGYGPEDCRRFALLHIEAWREGRARPGAWAQAEVARLTEALALQTQTLTAVRATLDRVDQTKSCTIMLSAVYRVLDGNQR